MPVLKKALSKFMASVAEREGVREREKKWSKCIRTCFGLRATCSELLLFSLCIHRALLSAIIFSRNLLEHESKKIRQYLGSLRERLMWILHWDDVGIFSMSLIYEYTTEDPNDSQPLNRPVSVTFSSLQLMQRSGWYAQSLCAPTRKKTYNCRHLSRFAR